MGGDPPKIRCVFDCMVFLQAAARREGPSAACLLLAELGAIELYVSQETMAEVRDVLARPRIRQKFPAMTDVTVERLMAAVGLFAVNLSDVPRLFTFDRDPRDEPYINLAIAANAAFLVSRDNDILDLVATSADGERLRSFTPALRIVDPGVFLSEIRRRTTQVR